MWAWLFSSEKEVNVHRVKEGITYCYVQEKRGERGGGVREGESKKTLPVQMYTV
jgi:hypothetical protein